jgi:DNA gyrase/topoisomerase IV subunit A
MDKPMECRDALNIAKESYTDYSLYVASGRAYPNLIDGLKSSYRRAIYGMYLNNTHKTVKMIDLAAGALPYHPHPSSIAGVIVQLGEDGNKLKLMETQGNWGDSTKGIKASADRYIGGYLSPLAEALLCDGIEYCEFVKGEIEKDEPKALPTLLPICFINGLKGIPSGLPTLNIPTMEIDSLIDYYLDILKHKDLKYISKKLPKPSYNCDIISGEDTWRQVLTSGKGTIKLAPKMNLKDNTIIIEELPDSKSAESVYKIIEKDILGDKVDFRDESTSVTRIIIEKVPYKQVNMEELYCRLYNKLQVNESCNLAFYEKDKIYVPCSFDKVVKANLQYLINTHQNRIKHQLVDLKLKLRVLEIIEALKTNTDIKKLVDMTTEEAIDFLAKKYKTEKEVASKVLQKSISYLTKAHLDEIEDLKNKIIELENDKSDIFEFLIKKYKNIKKEIKKQLERQEAEKEA